MGAPEVLIERISNGCELKQAVSVAYNLQMHGFKSDMSKEDIQQLADEKGFQLEHDETKTVRIICFQSFLNSQGTNTAVFLLL